MFTLLFFFYFLFIFVSCMYSFTLIFRYFTGCSLHLFLIIISLSRPKYLSLLKQPLGDLLQNNCSKSVLNEFKHACENVLFFIKVAGYRTATLLNLSLFPGIFFKDFDHTYSLIRCGIAILKNI